MICTRRRPQLLPASVDAVLAQDVGVAFEVIVVNDDAEPLRCRLPDDARLRVLPSDGHGLSRGRNTGIRAARGAIVAFTDDDTVAPPSWLAGVVRALAARPDALGVEGPVDYGCDVDVLYEHVPHPDLPGGYCGCNIAYRRDALLEVGMFDERFVAAGGEDIDLGLRIAALGPVVLEPSMVMVHPPRPITVWGQIRLARSVENDWLLHAKHPELSGKPRPSRFGPLGWRVRDQLRLVRSREVVAGSPARAVRAAGIAVGTVVVATIAVSTRAMPSAR